LNSVFSQPACPTRRYGPGEWLVNVLASIAVAIAIAFVSGAKAADKATSDPALRLLVFGDSLAAGYGVAPADAFPAQLERALRSEGLRVSVINAGVSGDTTAGGRARLGWILGAPDARPDAAIVELGANDALRGLDPARTYENLDAILSEFRRRDIPVLLAGMLAPRNLGPDYARSFDAVYPRLAEQHQVDLYPFFLEGVAGNRELNQPDGLHPTAAGIAQIVRRITPAVATLLRSAVRRSAAE
jgi:acyl-CoA thioesterase-1